MITDDFIMPYGKYVGCKISRVESGYLLWLYLNGKCSGPVYEYIDNNLAKIRKKANDVKFRDRRWFDRGRMNQRVKVRSW